MSPVEAEQPTYVYGLVKADTEIPDGLTGFGPSGRVLTIAFGRVAAIVSDAPTDPPLGVRGDLVAHEGVLAAVAARDAVVPMGFPAVVEEHAVVDELLAPNEEHFTALLDSLQGAVPVHADGAVRTGRPSAGGAGGGRGDPRPA